MRFAEARVAHTPMLALVILALSIASEVASAAPPGTPYDERPLEIGEVAYVDVELVFEVNACEDETYCPTLYELFDLFFNNGDDCRDKFAPVPLPVAECSFHVNGVVLGPFEAREGTFVAPATGLLKCESPATLPDSWDSAAKSWAETHGYSCGGDIAPVAMYDGHIELRSL